MNKPIARYFFIIFMLLGFISWSSPVQKNLNLSDTCDLFHGDWLDTWQDPKDPRFIEQHIDLKKAFKAATDIREELYKLRQKFTERYQEMSKLPKPNYIQLEKDISKATMEF